MWSDIGSASGNLHKPYHLDKQDVKHSDKDLFA
jgi:hypothetical protein